MEMGQHLLSGVPLSRLGGTEVPIPYCGPQCTVTNTAPGAGLPGPSAGKDVLVSPLPSFVASSKWTFLGLSFLTLKMQITVPTSYDYCKD